MSVGTVKNEICKIDESQCNNERREERRYLKEHSGNESVKNIQKQCHNSKIQLCPWVRRMSVGTVENEICKIDESQCNNERREERRHLKERSGNESVKAIQKQCHNSKIQLCP